MVPMCQFITILSGCVLGILHTDTIIEGVRARVGQPSIYNSCRFSFKYVRIEQTGKEL